LLRSFDVVMNFQGINTVKIYETSWNSDDICVDVPFQSMFFAVSPTVEHIWVCINLHSIH
jgi:hypothetical protein